MSKKYVLTMRVELDEREARDDVEARHQALAIFAECFGRGSDSVSAKLQEVFENRAPRSVRLEVKRRAR